MRYPKSADVILGLLSQFNSDLGQELGADVVAIKSPIRFGLDDAVRVEIENISISSKSKGKREKLSVLLETTGGFIETVERIHKVFRKHYKHVAFIVPNYAYSAGTVLALSGDEIYMDYYSVLGPIDPQLDTKDGFLPGLGYLQKYKQLRDLINGSQSADKVRAEMALLINKFDPALLFQLEQAKAHSISLLEEWLPKFKFKNWKKTKSNGKKVTAKMRKDRAREIAEILGDPSRWHSHGRGIGLDELTSDEIKLEIDNFGRDSDLNNKIRRYYNLLLDHCRTSGIRFDNSVIHSTNGLRVY